MSDTEEKPTAVVVTEQPKRALPGTGSKMTAGKRNYTSPTQIKIQTIAVFMFLNSWAFNF